MGLFWLFALLGFSVAVTFASSNFGNTRAIGYGSFVMMMGSIWFVILGFMSWEFASAGIIAGLIGIAVMRMSEK